MITANETEMKDSLGQGVSTRADLLAARIEEGGPFGGRPELFVR